MACGFIGLPYGEQLRRKQEAVRRALAAYASLAGVEVRAPVGSPRAFGYRNQAKLVARRARRGLLLGVYRPGTHQVVDISQCPVHHPLIARVLAQARAAMERLRVPTYDERSGRGWLRYLVLRCSAWQRAVQLILVVRDREPGLEQALSRALRRVAAVRSIVLNLNPSAGNVIFGERFVPLTKEEALIERLGAWRLKSHAGAFLQANLPAARRVYELVVRWAELEPTDVAVDLYAGVGAISFYLSPWAGRVYGIEESTVAVRDAKENIRLNGTSNVRFYCGGAAETLPRLAAQVGQVDVVVLNPPRKGAGERTCAAVAAVRPSRIVYVSCDPTSLARDLDRFASVGYRARKIQPFDLLPQTEHVECVAAMGK